MDEMLDLALHGIAGLANDLWIIGRKRHDLQAVADGSERVPEFVREEGDEFTGAAVLLFLGSNVTGNLGGADDLAVGISHGRNCERDVDATAVFSQALRLEVFDDFSSGEPIDEGRRLVDMVVRNQ